MVKIVGVKLNDVTYDKFMQEVEKRGSYPSLMLRDLIYQFLASVDNLQKQVTPVKEDKLKEPKVKVEPLKGLEPKVKLKPFKDVDLEKFIEYRENTAKCRYCSDYWFFDSKSFTKRKVYNHMKNSHPEVLTT